MYGLAQAGIMANKKLINNLAPHGYDPVKYTPCFWRHKYKEVFSALCVYDFLI